MKEFDFTVTDELGIHARPAGMLVKIAKKYQSSIKIKKDSKEALATSLLSMMSLNIKKGDNVKVVTDGADEDDAYEEVLDFFSKNL